MSDQFKLEAAVLRYLDTHQDWRDDLCDYSEVQEYLEDLKKIVGWDRKTYNSVEPLQNG